MKLVHGLTNVDLGDRIGCSDETISNAENERTDLGPVLLLNLEHEFGSGTIDPVTELAGSHNHPVDAEDGDLLLPLSSTIHRVIQNRAPDSQGGSDETHQEWLALEQDLLSTRRAVNGALARIRKLRG